MELRILPALKESCRPAFTASGLVRTSRSAEAAAAATPPGGAGLAALPPCAAWAPCEGAVRSELCEGDALAPVGASTAMAETSANVALPMTSLLTRESPCVGLDRATG